MSAGLFAVFHIFTLLSKQLVIAKGHGTINHVLLFRGINMANEQNLKPITSVSQARELQRKSAEKRKQNNAEKRLLKDAILERMGAEDWEAIVDGLIDRAKGSDKALELLRDTIGQKPSEKVDLSIEDESARAIDDYFAERYNRPSDK